MKEGRAEGEEERWRRKRWERRDGIQEVKGEGEVERARREDIVSTKTRCQRPPAKGVHSSSKHLAAVVSGEAKGKLKVKASSCFKDERVRIPSGLSDTPIA